MGALTAMAPKRYNGRSWAQQPSIAHLAARACYWCRSRHNSHCYSARTAEHSILAQCPAGQFTDSMSTMQHSVPHDNVLAQLQTLGANPALFK